MLVTVDFWHVPRRRAGHAAARMALDRPTLRRTSGLTFGKLLGTGSSHRFTPLDADPLRWALLAVWDTPSAARGFERSRTIRSWAGIADERWRVELRPVASRGRWSGRTPFGGRPGGPASHRRPDGEHRGRHGGEHGGGPVAAVTRARLAPRQAVAFWRAVPPVAAELRGAGGLLFAAGIGEAPIGLQGTFSLWRDVTALRAFAYQGPAHAAAVRRTPAAGWYAEELFARFVVLGSRGTIGGVNPLDIPPSAGKADHPLTTR
ncbi:MULTISPECIES: spheroidene monooxygenase [unclassified Parafrankia]|uniref:spheroidene monooxygenase n=1 Tax=unclassified Parafrankia TaxID=2994368 RepID=UPI000DA4C871|nr:MULTISPECIES: spheroidene monooxygenase [unclassified Parafrankia]TCJ36217.1 spheroidene monooxygenase [Parafrankia sp. BMG5.11]SQE00559.1 putative monooxygenase [Parafrankia sp. Ea1.12]